ncbi:Colicin V production protein [Arcobacter nitrofigilis DSM 7299]|uniref:Colicin V production protein n=1 Tax=Arcobacter nitrofigilis (strain ATCC 33309 / DSM 7299 / CCUG 15893 / LMG 7604 / NCTC 12251 / CI) TaxID=572480 RepID=D5V310_ARCNC|nr:CvpA family protein [Arcobacter nitrofigilis]ADG92592.1 Colicin V production protein [Arcobacter nitrofigilis DSM 7299]
MQEFSTFDMIIVGISVVLGLKGLFKGFIKEVFGLVGIIGGIFIASRLSETVGNLIKPLIGIDSNATLSLIGFVVTLIGFWILVYIAGSILSKMSEMSGLGALNRLFGFVFGTAKIFLIISVIFYALYQIQSFKASLDKKLANSIVFPVLVETGGFIVKLDTSKFLPNSQEVTKEETAVETNKENKSETTVDETKKEEKQPETTPKKETLGDKIIQSTSDAVQKVKETGTEIIKDTLTKPAKEEK